MEITVKVRKPGTKKPAAVVRQQLKAVDDRLNTTAKVQEVFPEAESGRRAGMVTVKLPDKLSDKQCKAVLKELRSHEDVEYAEPAAPRRARRP